MNFTKPLLLTIIDFGIFFMVFLSSGFSMSQDSGLYRKSVLTKVQIDRAIRESIGNWNYYMRNNLDSLKLDAYQIMSIGFENKNDQAINVGKRSLGTYLSRTGEPMRGIKYLRSSLIHFQKTGDVVIETEILNEIGNAFFNSGKTKEAEIYYLKSLKVGKESPDPTSAFLAESNLAQVYIALGELDKAVGILHHYKTESLRLMKMESVSNAYSLLGTIEQKKVNLKLAGEYFRKSAQFGFRSKARTQIAHAYNNMAIVHFQNGDRKASLEYFKKALDIRLTIGNSRAVSESYFNLGSYFQELKNYNEAITYYRIAEKYSKEQNLLKEEMDAVRALAEIYKLTGDTLNALKTMERLISIQEKYYADMSSMKAEDMELIESIEILESEYFSGDREAKLIAVINRQDNHQFVIYLSIIMMFAVLTLLVIYRKKVS